MSREEAELESTNTVQVWRSIAAEVKATDPQHLLLCLHLAMAEAFQRLEYPAAIAAKK